MHTPVNHALKTQTHQTTTNNSTPNTKLHNEFAYMMHTVHLKYITSKEKKEQMKLRKQASVNTHTNSMRNPVCQIPTCAGFVRVHILNFYLCNHRTTANIMPEVIMNHLKS